MEVTHPHLCLVQSERWEQHEEQGAGGGSGQTWWWLSRRGHREGAEGTGKELPVPVGVGRPK